MALSMLMPTPCSTNRPTTSPSSGPAAQPARTRANVRMRCAGQRLHTPARIVHMSMPKHAYDAEFSACGTSAARCPYTTGTSSMSAPATSSRIRKW